MAVRHGDVYFTTGDGLAEAQTVFLRGNGLPERWAGRGRFTVAETGFGTGLNIAALWALWQQTRPSTEARLQIVSFEAYPMLAADAARALGAWPELAAVTQTLLARWPHPALGTRHLVWPDAGISLTLHIGDIAETLPVSEFRADAWFLDGFSPARNETMWAEDLYPLIAERTAPGGTAATFTVAGAVRRGLQGAGFETAKVPGHGRKRQRLEAHLPSWPVVGTAAAAIATETVETGSTDSQKIHRVAVLGAGIMGACLANALRAAGCGVTVFDSAEGPGTAASGNDLALVMPRIDAADTTQARLLIEAYIAALVAYRSLDGALETDVRQEPRDDADRLRFAKILADPPLPLENLEALAGGGLLHKRALIVRPRPLMAALLIGAECRFGVEAKIDLNARTVNGEAFDDIVFANAMAVGGMAAWLGLVGRLGQVEAVHGCPDTAPSAMAAGDYAIAAGETRLWGATFEPASTPEPEITAAARAENMATLDALSPWWAPQVRPAEIQSRAGIRATTPDRLPVAGALPDAQAVARCFAPLAKGQPVDADVPRVPGAWLATGLGSRGFTFAPWIAALITSQITEAPLTTSRPLLAAVDPVRFLLRSIKRSGRDLA